MEISPRKSAKRTPEPVDEWLHNEGYFRKHAPRDPTCLFRAVSEQVYLTQHFHIRVRHECVKYMREHRHLFEKNVTIPYESYLEQMSCFTEWGGTLEIQAMSLLYKREVIVFSGQKLTRLAITDNGFERMIFLCHTTQKQYETVYTKGFVADAAYCQSLMYQTLYKDVFKMANIDSTVHKMLHDRTDNFRHDKFFLKENLEIREQLTTELYNKIDGESEKDEDALTIARGITPFPYRVAKALDPNIYRNTDFDIWQEIRREVRNAGWTRYNGMELQVGGKCLVHMDIKEDELDKTNNNCVYANNKKDNNGNEQNTTKVGKQEPLIFRGHIQEMSKNEGPVVVFIEELGEKKTVPFSALKPLSSWKNKQSTWGHSASKKNVLSDSNQKWNKSWVSNSRKIKDITNNDVLINNSFNRNNNHNANNNKDKSDENSQWDNDTGHDEENHSAMSFGTYTVDNFNSYQDYAIDAPIEVMPVTMALENSHSTVVESVQSEVSEEIEINNSPSKKNEDTESAEKIISTNSTSAVTSESSIQPSQYCNQRSQNETFYPLHSGLPQYFTSNPNVYLNSPEGNSYPVPPYFAGNPGESLIPNHFVDQTLRSINLSALKSIDVNGSDLPFSDTMTLRFFYNLGLEYFRTSPTWVCGVAGQSMAINPYYVAQANPSSSSSTVGIPSGLPLNEGGGSRATDDTPQKCMLSQRKEQSAENSGKGNGSQRTSRSYVASPELSTLTKDFHKMSLESSLKTNSPHFGSEKNIDQATQRTGRNSLAPRFKKNIEGGHRNSCQQMQQQQQQQQQYAVQYQHNAVNINSSALQYSKKDGGQRQRPNGPHQQTIENPSTYRVSYAQQTSYSMLPYYMGDAEMSNSFCTSNPGFFSLPYVPHSDMTDGTNVNHFLPHIYPNMDNYAQPYSTIYPQYLYPQQNVYPNVPPQNTQENWYPLPGQAHYIHYTQLPSPLPASPSNLPPQNVSTV